VSCQNFVPVQNKRTSVDSEDIAYWIARSRAIESMRGIVLSDEDEQRLEQIKAWCQASNNLWEVIARIGWEINEG